MRTRLPLLLLAVSPAFATSAIVLSPGFTGSATAPNSAPYSSVTAMRIEMRIWNWSAVTINSYLFQNVNWNIRQVPGTNTIQFYSPLDNQACAVDMTGRTDVIVRMQRDYANARVTCEIWNIQGTNYVLTTAPIASAPSPINISGTYSWGWGANTNVNLSYMRVYSSAAAPSNVPPSPYIPGGTLFDYEFDGNSRDRSGHSVNINFSGSPVYAADPTYAPAVILAALPSTVRAATSFALDASQSYALNGNPALTYLWRQTQFVPMLNTAIGAAALPQVTALQDQSQTASIATASPPLAGTYYFQVQVCDTWNQCSQLPFKTGVVPTDSNGIVIIPDSRMSVLLGPMTLLGSSPWPWYDAVMKADADAFGSGMPSGPPFAPTISGSPGTISVTNGSGTVTGNGTAFQTDFACNGTDGIVIYYQLANGLTGARPYFVTACSSQTSMTIVQGRDGPSTGAYDASASQSGLHYDYYVSDITVVGNESQWVNGSNNWNYYDGGCLAMYRTYYRSGIDTYLNYARQFCSSWWQFPLDGGRIANNGNYISNAGRLYALLGMMAYALDGHPDMWLDSPATGAPSAVSGIKALVDFDSSINLGAYFNPPYDPGDFPQARESGYAMLFDIFYWYLYEQYHANVYYSTIIQPYMLGSNSFLSRNHPGFGFTSDCNPYGANSGLTAYGCTGPQYELIGWLQAFLHKAIIAFIQTSPSPTDRASALSLLQSSYDSFFTNMYINGNYYPPGVSVPNSCQEIAAGANGPLADTGNMPINPSNGAPVGTVSVSYSSGAVVGNGTQFLTGVDMHGNPIFRNDGTDYIGIEWDNIPPYYSSCTPPGCAYQITKVLSITDDTHLTMATNFGVNPGGGSTTNCTLCSTSGLSFGRVGQGPTGLGKSNLPQNYYATLDASPYTCASPPAYAMGGRAIAELVHEINGFLYVNATSGNAVYKRQGDALFAAAYGCSGNCSGPNTTQLPNGGPGADTGAGNFADILVYGLNTNAGMGKEFGSNAGAGRADTYLAYRLGDLAAASNRTESVNFDLAAVPNAAKARISVWSPAGVKTTATCTASPCAVTVDARQGRHTYQVDYLSSGNAVLSLGKPTPLSPQ